MDTRKRPGPGESYGASTRPGGDQGLEDDVEGHWGGPGKRGEEWGGPGKRGDEIAGGTRKKGEGADDDVEGHGYKK